jgi:hypothetical protein
LKDLVQTPEYVKVALSCLRLGQNLVAFFLWLPSSSFLENRIFGVSLGGMTSPFTSVFYLPPFNEK